MAENILNHLSKKEVDALAHCREIDLNYLWHCMADNILNHLSREELGILVRCPEIDLNYLWHCKRNADGLVGYVHVTGKTLDKRIPAPRVYTTPEGAEKYLKTQARCLERALQKIDPAKEWDIRGWYLRGEGKAGWQGIASEAEFGRMNG